MERNKCNVIVNGMGNIGTTLTNMLVHYQSELRLDKIYVVKRSIHPWNKTERDFLEKQGVIICSMNEGDGLISVAAIITDVDYIFEATANGVGLQNLARYKNLPNLKGSSAQGSEKGYGIPFMSGVNNAQIKGTKFVNVVSCNTHGSAALLTTFCGNNLENLESADVVVVRRSEDLGNHERLVSANVVARHLDPLIGTHHAIDVVDMFKTKNIDCNLTSSDITTPSQLMHAVRFNITLKEPLNNSVEAKIASNPFIATTTKFDSNVLFELGRRYGFNGRIFSHAILISGNLLVTDKTIKGWAFVPQEGNSILSTIHAFLLQMNIAEEAAIFRKIQTEMIVKEW
ncbi:MAG: glyceraldehyde-3-phosphate dehydrogenase type II [Crocinitomix sp.]|jgi:glyceraldehyde-3-phosphate dehydrogenase type II